MVQKLSSAAGTGLADMGMEASTNETQMFHSARQTTNTLEARTASMDSKAQFDLMQMAINRILLDTLLAMGVEKSGLMAQLRDAAANLNMTANENAAVGIEMLTRHIRAA